MERCYSALRLIVLVSLLSLVPSQGTCRMLYHNGERVDWCVVQGEYVFFKAASWKLAVQNALQSRPSFTSSIEQAIA